MIRQVHSVERFSADSRRAPPASWFATFALDFKSN
jgi:hypothetical protein